MSKDSVRRFGNHYFRISDVVLVIDMDNTALTELSSTYGHWVYLKNCDIPASLTDEADKKFMDIYLDDYEG